MYLLDTDVCILAISDRFPRLNQRIVRGGDGVAISSIVYAELAFGVAKSGRPGDNLRQLQLFVARLKVLDFDLDAANHYGDVRAHLARKGTPIGPLDTLIAAHARARGATLVTNNRREFGRVPGLKVETWL